MDSPKYKRVARKAPRRILLDTTRRQPLGDCFQQVNVQAEIASASPHQMKPLRHRSTVHSTLMNYERDVPGPSLAAISRVPTEISAFGPPIFDRVPDYEIGCTGCRAGTWGPSSVA